MWKLYHLTQEINEAKEEVEKRTEQLSDLNGEVVSLQWCEEELTARPSVRES